MVVMKQLRAFLRDEDGAFTIWSLLWFILYVGIGGLAVDITDAYRTQSLLQSTADAAALAGALSLPSAQDAEDAAIAYASANLTSDINGIVLSPDDVEVGLWDFSAPPGTYAFSTDTGGAEPNAVRVITRRADANANPLATNFLRIIGLKEWDVAAEAIAVRYIPDCINEGFVAALDVDFQNDNDFFNNICVHGETGVNLQGTKNDFEPGVLVSMPRPTLDGDLVAPGPAYDTVEPNLAAQHLWPKDVALLDNYVAQLRALPDGYNPNWDFMYITDPLTGTKIPPNRVTGSDLPPVLVPYTVYDINCSGQLNLGSSAVLNNVVIVASCRIHAAASMSAGKSVIASTYDGPNAAIDFAAQSSFAGITCPPLNAPVESGVELYATDGDIKIAAQGTWPGMRVVAAGTVDFASNNMATQGISVQAGERITFNSNSDYGLCPNTRVNAPFAFHYKLVW